MPLIQRSFFYQNFEFHLSYSLGKFLLTAKNSKIFGNVRDLRISPSWSWYFVRYHQSSPLLLHVLSQVMDLATVNCSEQGQDYSSQEITHNLIILGHGRVRRRQKNLPSLEQGTWNWDFAPFDNYLWAQQNEEWDSVWGKVVTEIRMSFPRENKNKVNRTEWEISVRTHVRNKERTSAMLKQYRKSLSRK